MLGDEYSCEFFFRKSTMATNNLKKALKKNGHLKLKSCVEIRWKSEHDSFERLVYHEEYFETMYRREQVVKISNSVLTRQEGRLLKSSVTVLKPVKESM